MLTNSLLYYFFLVYLARSKRPNTPHFVFKRIVRNFEVRVGLILSIRSQDIEQKPNSDVNQGP